MSPERKEKPAMIRKTLFRMLIGALALGLPTAQAQDQEEPSLIVPDRMALLRAEPLESRGDVTATPERLFLGNCSSCHGTDTGTVTKAA